MKITIFTGNQARHAALVRRLAAIADQVFAIVESTTVVPGQVQDFFAKSEVMQRYFARVIAAERTIFGDLTFLPENARALIVKNGDLNHLSREQLAPALESDVFVVFGASYIKGWLIDELVAKGAINIHMGLSPYYRGSSCNFWALYDERPEHVGATIHLLSKGLDSGAMLYHALPTYAGTDPFAFTMQAVEAAQRSLVARIESGELRSFVPQVQDKSLELRYTRNADFNDAVAGAFLARDLSPGALAARLAKASPPPLLRPFFA